jgi:hypothetical protein
MFGKFASDLIKVATLPLDAGEIMFDLATGGNGNRKELKDIFPCGSTLRDKVCETIEKIDD